MSEYNWHDPATTWSGRAFSRRALTKRKWPMAIHTETDRYKLETTRNGLFVVLTRKADGADAHMQGDAAGQALEEAEELSACWRNSEAKFREFFDYWASQYDDVMERRDA